MPKAANAETDYDLRSRSASDSTSEVKITLEVAGKLKLNPDGKNVRETPMNAKAKIGYEEKSLKDSATSIRFYHEAEVDFKVGTSSFTTSLQKDHQWIAVDASGSELVPYSPLGPLSREELEVIDVPANSLILSELLPDKRLPIGQSWPIADATLARLLCLDVVHKAEVKGTLKSVEKSVAILYFEGTVQASVNGVASDLEVLAKANFDMTLGYISWINLAFKENRAIGQAEPGYEVVSKIGVAIRRLPKGVKLTDDQIAGLPLKAEPKTDLQFDSKENSFRLLMDRRWRVMTDREDGAILRLVERGDLIAQCNITGLPDQEPGRYFSIEDFQADVEDSLGESFQEFAHASQSVTEDGIRVLRLVALGQSADLPVQWIYYNLADSSGRQMAMVFTLDARLVERFGELDRPMATTFQFLPRASRPMNEEPAVEEARKADATDAR